MALNFTHPLPFPPCLSDDRFVSSFGVVSGGNSDEFARPWYAAREMRGFVDYGRDCINQGDSHDSASHDILDLLPADPFGMDISSTFNAAITGWLENLEIDYGGCRETDMVNFIWNNATGFGYDSLVDQKATQCRDIAYDINLSPYQDEENDSINGNMLVDSHQTSLPVMGSIPSQKSGVECLVVSSYHECSETVCDMDVEFGYGSGVNLKEDISVAIDMCDDVGDTSPHAALSFALGYLNIIDLLSVERVCKSLYYSVRSDPLLWRTIHIDQQLSERLSDDSLMQLTDRALGKLDCLSLADCTKITDYGLSYVLHHNPCLTKLSVPGCTRLTVEGVMNSLKAVNSGSVVQIKRLRIGALYGMTEKYYQEMKTLLGVKNQNLPGNYKPHFFRRGSSYLPLEDDRPIDIEMCPRCQNFRLIYDCPTESCPGVGSNHHDTEICRACIICIPRCFECGRCINDGEFEETFCLELLCSDCGVQLSLDSRAQTEKIVS